MVNVADACLVLTQNVTPPPVPLVDFTVADAGDGGGPRVVSWSARLGPQPTADQLAAVTAQQVAAYYQQQRQAAALALLGDASPAGVALRAVYLAAGLTAQQVAAQLAAAAQAGVSVG